LFPPLWCICKDCSSPAWFSTEKWQTIKLPCFKRFGLYDIKGEDTIYLYSAPADTYKTAEDYLQNCRRLGYRQWCDDHESKHHDICNRRGYAKSWWVHCSLKWMRAGLITNTNHQFFIHLGHMAYQWSMSLNIHGNIKDSTTKCHHKTGTIAVNHMNHDARINGKKSMCFLSLYSSMMNQISCIKILNKWRITLAWRHWFGNIWTLTELQHLFWAFKFLVKC